jgi:hypothetical protein
MLLWKNILRWTADRTPSANGDSIPARTHPQAPTGPDPSRSEPLPGSLRISAPTAGHTFPGGVCSVSPASPRCVSHVDRIHMGDTPGTRRSLAVARPSHPGGSSTPAASPRSTLANQNSLWLRRLAPGRTSSDLNISQRGQAAIQIVLVAGLVLAYRLRARGRTNARSTRPFGETLEEG